MAFACIQSSTARIQPQMAFELGVQVLDRPRAPCRRPSSPPDLPRARLDVTSTLLAAAMISERSTGMTVMPEACSSFSLARTVWKAAGRAPIAPMRALRRPLATRQTAAKNSRSRAKAGLSSATVCVPVSVKGMPYWRRLLHTEILPQNESRRWAVSSLSKSSSLACTSTGTAELGQVQGVDDAHLVAEVRQSNDNAVDLVAVLVEQIGALAGVGHGLDGARSASLPAAE